MKKSFAFALLLAATALSPGMSPAFAQEATEAEPTPIPERTVVQMSQNDGREARGPRGGNNQGGGERPQWQGNRGGNDGGGWQRREQAPQAAPQPVPQAAPQAMPQRDWGDRGEGRGNWRGRGEVAVPQGTQTPQAQPDWSQRRNGGEWGNRDGAGRNWQRNQPPVVNGVPTQPVPQAQPGWQGRNDGWRSRNGDGVRGGVQVQPRPEGQRWNNGNNGWNGQQRGDGWRGDGWRGDGWRGDGRRNDTWRNGNDGRRDGWNGNNGWNGRNDSWQNRNNGWNGSRIDGRRGYDLRPQFQNQYRGWTRNWSNDWRRDQRYDWQRYRSYNRGLFAGNRYDAPYGWDYGYRRFGVGFTLSYVLFNQEYWIDDPWSYRLPETYGPYRWVRYYDDVLLVDLRSGRVIDVIHDFFW